MPLYVGDYLADTARFNTEQHGAYLLLMFDYWREGPPPDDDSVLASITKLSIASWRKARVLIEPKFTIENGVWTHGRIDKELSRAIDITDKRSIAGKASAVARKAQQVLEQNGNKQSTHVATHGSTNAQQNARPSQSQLPNTKELPPSPPSKPVRRGTRLPDDWKLPKRYALWAMEKQPTWNEEHVRKTALEFSNFWTALPGAKATKLDWEKTWQNWVLKARPLNVVTAVPSKPLLEQWQLAWHATDRGIEWQTRELGRDPKEFNDYQSMLDWCQSERERRRLQRDRERAA